MCLNPKWIYKKGYYKENNYNGYKGEPYEIGTFSKCGVCEQCISEKCNNWVIRNYYEEKKHEKKCFITLTYKENPILLIRKDAQDFIKRLRRYLEYNIDKNIKIRFYGCGEYGEVNNRPHLHFIIYGWNDPNAKYLTFNKKYQIVYQSEIIQKVWGLGRTSYQEYGEREVPYISLYNTPAEEFKKAYKLTFDKLKKLKDITKSRTLKNRKNILIEIKDLEKELEKNKKKYVLSKEFIMYSKSLGWEEFEKQYDNYSNYTFTEYIQDKEFVTPSPWVKKLANKGDYNAILEMRKREEMIQQSENEEEEKKKNFIKINKNLTTKLKEWKDKKDKITYL